MKKLTANAARVRLAITAALLPVLAQDAQIGDLTAIAGSVKSLKTAKAKTALVDAITTAYGDKLAADATLDHLPRVVDALALDEDPEIKPKTAEDEDDADEEKVPPKDANDSDDDDDKKVDKTAMDAAIATAVTAATTATVARMQAIHRAEREVEPLIGKIVVAQDSAEGVYKLALDAAKIDTTGVHPSAYRAMVGMLPKAAAAPVVKIAQDAAGGATAFAAMFPNAGNMKGGV